MLLEAVADSLTQLINGPFGSGDSNNRNTELATTDHGLQGWKDFLECEITGHSIEHQRIRTFFAHCPCSCRSFRYRRIRLFVELSCWSTGSDWLSSSEMMRCASTLPSSTPH